MSDTPAPIVILGTGRSFTSVICCMIGQHPRMIGLPETNVFRDDSVGALLDRFSQPGNRWRTAGLLRTLAHFHDGVQDDAAIHRAADFLDARRSWSFRDLAGYLAEQAAPRGIVEKSISTCREPATLARVRAAWPTALYLHATRQPEAVVASMQSRVDQALERRKGGKRIETFLRDRSLDSYYSRYTLRIMEFMATLAPGQGMHLRGEDFLTDAPLYLRQICDWAGLDASDAAVEAMLHPENNPFAFPGPDSARGGMSATFLANPHFSGKPVPVRPMTVDPDEPGLDDDRRMMALLGRRLGYA